MARIDMRALAQLRPGINCGPKPGLTSALHVDDIRWDEPLPVGFVRPTQAEVEAEMARQATPPIETTKLRFALELKARGMWPAVKAAIAANEDASMYWDFTDIVRSDNQMLLALAGQMSVSAAEVREIVTAAIARQV